MDAKNYKGGSDTKYVNLDPRNLVRMSISRRALIKGSDGTPVVKMSENMATQRDNWASTLETYHVAAQWMVCMVPGGHNGNPDVSEAVWPSNVRVVTPGQLVAEIQSLSLLPVDNIPPRVVRLFTSAVKQQTPAPAAPATNTVPMPATSPVPAPIPQPAITNNCPKCGQPLNGQTNFCPNCGTPLNA